MESSLPESVMVFLVNLLVIRHRIFLWISLSRESLAFAFNLIEYRHFRNTVRSVAGKESRLCGLDAHLKRLAMIKSWGSLLVLKAVADFHSCWFAHCSPNFLCYPAGQCGTCFLREIDPEGIEKVTHDRKSGHPPTTAAWPERASIKFISA